MYEWVVEEIVGINLKVIISSWTAAHILVQELGPFGRLFHLSSLLIEAAHGTIFLSIFAAQRISWTEYMQIQEACIYLLFTGLLKIKKQKMASDIVQILGCVGNLLLYQPKLVVINNSSGL